ncbi:MAG TPA: hypothetical protein VL306_01635 [Methylomirabilota bacterium]|jgi:hypothetical protein|nr:hypothetical protein [Methylomirabilota bacterium]
MLNPPEVPLGLFEKVISRIKAERIVRAMRRRFVYALGFFILTLGVMVSLWQRLWLDLSQSGIPQYLSLVIYDSKAVLANWQDFGLSLLESLPITSVIVFFTVVFCLLLSLSMSFKYAKGFRQTN